MHRFLPCLSFPDPVLADIREKLLAIGTKEKGRNRRQFLMAVLPYFLYQFTSAAAFADTATLPPWLASLIRQMEEPDNFIAGLPRLITLANLSQEHLNRSFQRFLHMSPTEFINLRRMEYAASLLLEERLQIIDICQECGFSNLSYFYHIFRKQYGCSPRQFILKTNHPQRLYKLIHCCHSCFFLRTLFLFRKAHTVFRTLSIFLFLYHDMPLFRLF